MKRILSLLMQIFIVLLVCCQPETTGSNEPTEDVTETAYYHIIFHYNITVALH
ncbi:MAG: hypothetical protein IKN25_04850 [Spirochaetales bacterium]|nr:hypothetical protein [Spirochaetales bacterium]MBR6061208.1 hypothetical protein [Spirochaetales bacterium]